MSCPTSYQLFQNLAGAVFFHQCPQGNKTAIHHQCPLGDNSHCLGLCSRCSHKQRCSPQPQLSQATVGTDNAAAWPRVNNYVKVWFCLPSLFLVTKKKVQGWWVPHLGQLRVGPHWSVKCWAGLKIGWQWHGLVWDQIKQSLTLRWADGGTQTYKGGRKTLSTHCYPKPKGVKSRPSDQFMV